MLLTLLYSYEYDTSWFNYSCRAGYKYQEVAVSNQQIQKVKVKRLAHIGLWATDVLLQARFYHQVLGLDLRTTSDTPSDLDLEEANLFFALDDEPYCLGLFYDSRPVVNNGRKPVVRSPLHHLAFTVDTDAELAALAARLQMAGMEVVFGPREGELEQGDALWLRDPDGNRIAVTVATDELFPPIGTTYTRRSSLRPQVLQHIALNTPQLEEMVEFYTEALGFDISDWLLRERAWLRCNANHHTIMFTQGQPGIDHIGFTIADNNDIVRWADLLYQQEVQILWGPGRHGAGNDLFVRFANPDGTHIELSAGLQQYHDRDVTIAPRLWHTRTSALNLWGVMPSWLREEVQV
jgi:catechol 2,3-dioxygenase-like lactoylglutathione lyase family enzyme